jgi:hypothetical protein
VLKGISEQDNSLYYNHFSHADMGWLRDCGKRGVGGVFATNADCFALYDCCSAHGGSGINLS